MIHGETSRSVLLLTSQTSNQVFELNMHAISFVISTTLNAQAPVIYNVLPFQRHVA